MEGRESRRLTTEEIEEICELAEEAARRHILSKMDWRRISSLNIMVEAGGKEELTFNVDVEVVLSPLHRGFDVNRLVDGAVKAAFKSIDESMEKYKCQSKR